MTETPRISDADRAYVDNLLRDQRCSSAHLTDEQLTAAIIRALPIDHDDHSTVTRITLNEQTDRRNVIWGRPEWLAAEILASIRSAEMESLGPAFAELSAESQAIAEESFAAQCEAIAEPGVAP